MVMSSMSTDGRPVTTGRPDSTETLCRGSRRAARHGSTVDRDVIAAVLADPGFTGVAKVDSHALTDTVVALRSARDGTEPVSWDQTRDYVQYVLRETSHVCGHAVDGHWYLVHRAEVCGDDCKARRSLGAPIEHPTFGNCPHCYLPLPATRVCGWC